MMRDIESYITMKAREMSFGDPCLADDLAQEARLRIYLLLRDLPASPYSHQVNKVKAAMWHYRVKGKSVDGKLHAYQRKWNYRITSLTARNYQPTYQRPTEALALLNIIGESQ